MLAVWLVTLLMMPGQLDRGFGERYLQDASYGERIGQGDGSVTTWWASSGWKIGQTRLAPVKKGKCIQIAAAKNETEAAQLVLRADEPIKNLHVSVSSLRGPCGAEISAANLEILRVQYLVIAEPTDFVGVAGPWPDPLPRLEETLDLAPGMNQPLWIRVYVPRDMRAGKYEGQIRVTGSGVDMHVPLRVTVYDFVLPDRMTCTTALGFDPGLVFRYQNVQEPSQQRQVLEKYLRDFSAHHISPYDPAPLDHFVVNWDKAALKADIDWTAWDKAMSHAIDDLHFNSFTISIPGMGGELLDYKDPAPEFQKAFKNYCQTVQDHLRAKGWLDEAYVYWIDEPAKEQYEYVTKGFRRMQAVAPDIQGMLTEQVEPELVGGPKIWCPLTPAFDEGAAELRRKAGEKFWWYICTGPKGSFCTEFIDHPGTELRAWLWQTWQRKIDGILVWQTNWWTSSCAYPDEGHPQNPYDDPMSWMTGYGTAVGKKAPWGNGDGRFIYPPEKAASARPEGPVLDGPVESIRWEMLRDGIEDYEYLAMLRELINKNSNAIPADKRRKYEELLLVPASITQDLNHFTTAPEPIEVRRDSVARAIEELASK